MGEIEKEWWVVGGWRACLAAPSGVGDKGVLLPYLFRHRAQDQMMKALKHIDHKFLNGARLAALSDDDLKVVYYSSQWNHVHLRYATGHLGSPHRGAVLVASTG